MYLTKEKYKNYILAMRKNNCKPQTFVRLFNHLNNDSIYTYEKRSCWICGNHIDNIYFPSHVGYNSLRDLIKLLNELLDMDNSIIFTVLENMGSMLEKIGYIYMGRINVDYPYPMEKVMYTNNISLIEPIYCKNII